MSQAFNRCRGMLELRKKMNGKDYGLKKKELP